MTAEILRRAAALMRERASRAEARRWYPSDEHDGMDEIHWWDITAALPGDDDDPINEFVDSWHPTVALAVADWLDSEVMAFDLLYVAGYTKVEAAKTLSRHALTVARAFLGESA
ncbi:hypothetical protein FB382_003921 [Nocardioides ginsengisegetis]|uniref:Uncharacterized protein n=1 Tax=Nocardioides ginsengisegetis TaxID=661491 RepID=A0A7W3J3D9_9ACTN|nr:hypothetical protein [Nocardioides ginsengisegetis]MBA8801711.1 hypothetical protein [Nocardioides ginsengisegetis]MBA8805576.1 hypothetical protein [Nocardioides ginsengisegetis]